MFYPSEMQMTVSLKYIFNGTKVLVTKEPVTFVGEVTTLKPEGVVLVLKNPLVLVETHASTDVIAKVIILEKKWISPVIKEDNELKILKEIIGNGTLTYVFVREKVVKYIISKRLNFSICPGKTNYQLNHIIFHFNFVMFQNWIVYFCNF